MPTSETNKPTPQAESSQQDEPAVDPSVGAFLYAKLNYLFACYPKLDELGLVVAMPPGGGNGGGGGGSEKEKTSQTDGSSSSSPAPSSDPSTRFDQTHPPPASLLSLQSAHCAPFRVFEGTKLGVAFWCIPLLVQFTIHRFQQLRTKMKEEKIDGPRLTELARMAREEEEKQKEADGAGNKEEIKGPFSTLSLPLDLICCTRILLLINADNYTAWNVRKLLLSAPPLPPSPSSPSSSVPIPLLTPESELSFLNLVYSKHPKSGESWSHRRWVLSRIPGFDSPDFNQHNTPEQPDDAVTSSSSSTSSSPSTSTTTASSSSLSSPSLFHSEVSMCERSAELYPKNYYAWMHRQWMVERINNREQLVEELSRASEWTESHINDYCGFFHRQVIWRQIMRGCQPTDNSVDAHTMKKGDLYAAVHANLPQKLNKWSHTDDRQAHGSTATMAASTPVPAVAPAVSPSPSSSSPSPPVPFSHLVASCRFCLLFTLTEWNHLNELQVRYPGHESLWMHRRFVWITHVLAFQQHQLASEEAARTAETDSSSSPSLPTWLSTLLRREMEFADQQIADVELANYEANRHFATIYKVWLLQAALTVVYEDEGKKTGVPLQQSHQPPSSSSVTLPSSLPPSFPLLPLLSPAHRSWYLRLLLEVERLPELKSRAHWRERAQATAAAGAHSDAQQEASTHR